MGFKKSLMLSIDFVLLFKSFATLLGVSRNFDYMRILLFVIYTPFAVNDAVAVVNFIDVAAVIVFLLLLLFLLTIRLTYSTIYLCQKGLCCCFSWI